MTDARDGIVRLDLPDGRSVPLQLSYAALDARGHDWMLAQFKAVQKAKTGSSTAMADLLEVLSSGEIDAAAMLAGPVSAYPLSSCLKATWAAWEIAQYGPQGRPAEEGPANPQTARPWRTLWNSLFGRRSGHG